MKLTVLRKAVQKAVFLHSKTSLVMKLTAVLLLAACLHVNARGFSQLITISERNAPLQKVFKEISKQTDYHFFLPG